MTKKTVKKEVNNKSAGLKVKIKDWHVLLFFAIITILFFWDILTQKKFFWEDFVYQYYPFRNFAAVALSNGVMPFWNPYTFGGMPFIADIQTAFFYPLHLLLTLFVSGDSLNFAYLEYLIIFHYFLAGVFSYYLAKSFKLNVFACILTGITFMFSGFMVTHLIHETMIIQFTYMPLIFLFYHKSLEKISWESALVTGLIMGIAILCGHPQITLYIFFTMLLYAIYKLFFIFKDSGYKYRNILLKYAGIAALPFVIGIMIGSIQLFPTMRISGLSERAVMTYESTLEGSLNYHHLFTLLSPKFFGSTNAAHNEVPYWADKGYWLYWESCIYVGLAALVFGGLALYVLRKDRNVLFLGLIALLSLLYVLGDHFIMYKLFYYIIPGFDKFRGVGRFGLVFSFSLSLLAGFGFDYFVKNPAEKKLKKYLRFLLFGTASLVLLWILYQANVFKSLANVYSNTVFYKNSINQLGLTILILLILIGLIMAYSRNYLLPSITLTFIILTAFFDMFIFGANHNASPNNPNRFYKQRGIAAQFREEGRKELFRINSRSKENAMIFDRNQGMIDFIFLMEGYNPLNLNRKYPPGKTYDLLNVKYVTEVDTKNRTAGLAPNYSYMPRAWMSYKPVWSNSDENTTKILLDSTFNYRECIITDIKPDILIDTIPGKYNVRITNYELNKIIISAETDKNGILVLSEVSYPAWKVYVDGVEKQVLRCDYSLRGVAIEKGKHNVMFVYKDKDFKFGLYLSCAGLGTVIIGIGMIKRKKIRKAA